MMLDWFNKVLYKLRYYSIYFFPVILIRSCSFPRFSFNYKSYFFVRMMMNCSKLPRLCISTRKLVLCLPLAGQNFFFSILTSFLDKITKKKSKKMQKCLKIQIRSTSVYVLLLNSGWHSNAGRLLGKISQERGMWRDVFNTPFWVSTGI